MLHFSDEEFEARRQRLLSTMAEQKLDALALFAQESMYWLTGFDSFGYCFFQCLVVKADGTTRLLTRSPDLRQARHTSNIESITIWRDRGQPDPVIDLRDLLDDMNLLGARIGVEWATHGMTGFYGRAIEERLGSFAQLRDASTLVPMLRAVKSEAEIAYIREAAKLTDRAFEAGLAEVRPGADEAAILAAMQGSVLAAGGDYPANPFVIGSGRDALLCRSKSGRRTLDSTDQLTLEWAGVKAQYHVPAMRTLVIGRASDRHRELHVAAREALSAVEEAMRPGATFGEVFDAHANVMEAHDLVRHRLNACGYSVGARYAPSWMDRPMFHAGNAQVIEPNMSLFAHMIIMDSDTETAMTLGRTYLTTEDRPQSLSDLSTDLTVVEA